MFKIIVICCVLSLGCVIAKKQSVQLAPEKSAKISQDVLQCIGENGIDPSIVLQFKDKKLNEDESVKKLILCSARKIGIASKKGSIQVEELLKIYPDKVDKEAIKKAILECQQENGEPIDKVYNFFKCYIEKTPVHIKLF